MQIFNLAEELEKERKKNKKLEERIKELKADYGNKAQVERDLLQIRIDKAIEYIEQYDSMTAIVKKLDEEGIIGFDGNFGIKEELLDILKGENK